MPDATIEVRNLTRAYGPSSSIEVLKGVDLVVQPGEYVAISGPSGVGKSTLLNVLGLLDTPTSGSYRLAGCDTATLGRRQRAARRGLDIGFVFQAFHLLPHRTAVENVTMALRLVEPRPIERRRRALAALEQVGLAHRSDAYPSTLSGGERQRVAIARAIVAEPALILADEPTGNLDSVTSGEILDLLDRLHHRGLTIVVITHDLDVSSRADRSVAMLDGRLATTNEPRVDAEETGHSPEPPASLSSGIMPDRTPVATTVSRARDLLSEALASVLSRPVRTLLTALGSVLGISALLTTVGIAQTAGNRIVSRFDAFTATEITVETRQTSGDGGGVELPWDPQPRLGRLNGVVSAGALAVLPDPGPVRTTPALDASTALEEYQLDVYAVSAGLFDAARATASEGRLFDPIHHRRADTIAVLGPGAAKRLGLTRVQSQPSIFIGGNQFVVIGILADTTIREPALLNAVIIPAETAEARYDRGSPDRLLVDVIPGAASLIAGQVPAVVNPNDPASIVARRSAEPVRVRDEVQQDLNGLFLLLGGISLIIGAIGIANVTLVSVLERRSEIGLRGALGETRATVAVLYLAEGTLIGTVAGILGASLGTLIVVAVAAGKHWTPVLSPWIVIAAPLLGGAIGMLASAYPAWRAASIDPADALRGGM